jgi:hypothetical protein
MEMKMGARGSELQGTATPKTAQTGQDATPLTKADALQSLRDQIRQTERAQIAGATGQGASQGATPAAPTEPTAPTAPRTITIQGRNGAETITLPSDFSAGDVIPPQVVDISIAFFVTMALIIIGLPIARAFARRMDRRAVSTQIPNEVSAQLTQLNQAVDAIALEVERISEGQRFTTRLLSEQREAARATLPSPTERR